MVPSGPSAASDLSKLTVPQLKALCKERRITGYSKLSKPALLQKLAEIVPPTNTSLPSNDSTAAPLATPAAKTCNLEPSIAPTIKVVCRPAQPSTTLGTESTEVSTGKVPPSTELAKSSRNRNTNPRQASNTKRSDDSCTSKHTRTVIQPTTAIDIEMAATQGFLHSELAKPSQNHTTNPCQTFGAKRPAHTGHPGSPKRIRTTLEPTTYAVHEPPVQSIPTLQQRPPANPSAFEVPGLPAQHEVPLRGSTSTRAEQPSGVNNCSAESRHIPCDSGRFKPIMVSRHGPVVEHDKVNKETCNASVVSATPRTIGFHREPLPILAHISLPPKASERKWVYHWAIILSALSPTDRKTCMLVSRTFRYAVYLSAVHILSRNYAGRRSDAILAQHPRNMTNFWPYLRHRKAEVSERRRAFEWSFLGQYTTSLGYDPLSKYLWTSPNDEKQVDIAIRFVLTRMWFAISVGAYGHDASTWSRSVIQDVREVVKGEVWQVIAQDVGSGESSSFYVLEATCEVIGHPPSLCGEASPGYSLRADWTTWISQQSSSSGSCTLLECVKWSNTEDYHHGISKAWSQRIQGQDADNIAKRSVAERYVLASVVANSISGRWMSTNAIAQEFAGLPDRNALGSGAARRSMDTVNMYLPAHHHIESVHFTTSKGESLHGAVAVVQTPGREYYVLRDNGMQVGCEEEGIPWVWQRILGCDTLGRAH